MRGILVVLFSLILIEGQTQSCMVEMLGDRAVISYETSLGKGSNSEIFYKTQSSSFWKKASNVSGDVGIISKSQQKYIVIWDYMTECKASPVISIKVRLIHEGGLEDELLWQSSDANSFIDANSEKPKVFDFVQKDAEYPGGRESMYNELGDYIYYPKEARAKEIEGVVYVSFIIELDGTVSQVEVMRGIEKGEMLNEVAVQAIKQLKYKFYPAQMNGNDVRYRMRIPIKFALN
jgi:TonB family protein